MLSTHLPYPQKESVTQKQTVTATTEFVEDEMAGKTAGPPSPTRDGNGYKPIGFCYPKPVPVKNIYTH
jgi:hypothetical protein